MKKRIVLTGGIACGKSLAATFLRELGVATLDADDIVHELLPDPAERRRIAAEVFADEQKRRELEARLHPQVKARLAAFAAADGEEVRVEIVPLLFEAGFDVDYDFIICLKSSRETQIRRMLETRGMTLAEAEARLNAQLPVAEKAARSDYVVENDGTAAQLKEKIAALVGRLKEQL